MKKIFFLIGVLVIQVTAFSQGTLVRPGGPSYNTGTLVPPAGVSGTAGDIRSRSFDGADYFSSGSGGVDTSFALRLGNGVSPLSISGGGGVELVPEPSTYALGGLGLLLLLQRSFKKKLAPQ